jgi:tetratricopeptide (TPR) repeat protein
MLAKIALARHDPDSARDEAALAREADPTLPLPIYIDARLLYDQGKYVDAFPLFEEAIAELKKSALQITELHFYAADTLGRLERYEEAEAEFLEELKYFPQNTRARAGLAMIYQATEQPEAAARVVAEMTRITPTPESYALAAKLFTMFGDRKQAEAVRAEGRRATKLRIEN